MVTHDQEEALIMADRLVVMSEGSVRQVGTQRELYERPADRFVAGFVGRSNLLSGTIVGPGRFQTEGGLSIACAGGALGPGVIALRPERLVLGAAAASFDNRLRGTVELVSYLGASIDVHVRVSPADASWSASRTAPTASCRRKARRIDVGWPSAAAIVLSETGEAPCESMHGQHDAAEQKEE